MKKYFINDGISGDSMKKMLRCFTPEFKNYAQGEIIMRYSDSIKKIGLVRSGFAYLHSLDANGDSCLLENYQEKDLFGELFYLPLAPFEYLVTAGSECQVVFIDYKHIITPCQNTCPHHSQLINNLFFMAAERAQALSLRLNILSQPTTRKKLLTYLIYIQSLSQSNPFVIPISRSALAEYLCVDRSAMTREIQLMEKDGLLRANKREFFLC